MHSEYIVQWGESNCPLLVTRMVGPNPNKNIFKAVETNNQYLFDNMAARNIIYKIPLVNMSSFSVISFDADVVVVSALSGKFNSSYKNMSISRKLYMHLWIA